MPSSRRNRRLAKRLKPRRCALGACRPGNPPARVKSVHFLRVLCELAFCEPPRSQRSPSPPTRRGGRRASPIFRHTSRRAAHLAADALAAAHPSPPQSAAHEGIPPGGRALHIPATLTTHARTTTARRRKISPPDTTRAGLTATPPRRSPARAARVVCSPHHAPWMGKPSHGAHRGLVYQVKLSFVLTVLSESRRQFPVRATNHLTLCSEWVSRG